MSPAPFTTRRALIILLVWCVISVLLGAVGALATLRPPVPQVILLAMVALLLMAYRWAGGFRKWISSLPLEWLIALHLVRFVGVDFLWLYHQGKLPFAFAVPGGCGDILVAALALLLLATRPASRVVYFIWNALGLVDILFVVATAARLALANPESMAELLRLPLSLLPTFIVPLIIFTHIVLFFRIKNEQLLTNELE